MSFGGGSQLSVAITAPNRLSVNCNLAEQYLEVTAADYTPIALNVIIL